MMFLLSPVLAATLNVDGGTYTTVQEAVDASVPGDIIAIAPGVWTGSVTVTHDLTLRGTSDVGTAILSGAPALTTEGATVTVEGLSFTPSATDARGLVLTSSTIHLTDVAVVGFERSGLNASGSDVNGLRVRLIDNANGQRYSANYFQSGSLTLTDSVIRGMSEETGLNTYQSDVVLETVEISGYGSRDESFEDYEPALDLSLVGTAQLTNVSIVNGGAALDATGSDGSLHITGGIIGPNVSEYCAGLNVRGPTLIVDGTAFENNRTIRSFGSCGYGVTGSAIRSNHPVELRNATFAGNTTCDYLGASVAFTDDALIEDVVFVDGDALLLDGDESEVHVRRSEFGGGLGVRVHGIQSATVEENTFLGTLGLDLTGIDNGNVLIRNNLFDGPDAYQAITSATSNESFVIEGSTFLGTPDTLVSIENAENLSFVDNRVCLADPTTPAFAFEDVGDIQVSNNVFGPSVVGASSGNWVTATDSSAIRLDNNVFVGADTIATGEDTAIFARNNLFLDLRGEGVAVSGAGASLVSSLRYNALFDSTGTLSSQLTVSDTLVDDPMLSGGVDCSTDFFLPGVGSPLIDSGDPTITDLDGSRSDIGRFGGPEALVVEDADGDGAGSLVDCDDNDASRYPGAIEIWYDGIDQDCDGSDDDQDGDGFVLAEDCDDTEPSANPNGVEVWYDGIDQNCDGNDDDQDGDGFPNGEDCDDNNPSVHPDATEVFYDGVDQNCDGNDDDQDGDSFPNGEDCDDNDPLLNPDATEVWYDGVDQNCDGNDDDQDGDGDPQTEDCDDTDSTFGPSAPEVWYDGIDQNCDGNDNDQDHDGSPVGTDCDDTDANRYPGAVDIPYDTIDQDCDGIDSVDLDGDGFDGTQAGGTDCNDGDAAIHPDAAEIWYDGIDQNCDGNDDDQDEDGAPESTDCDDTNADMGPGATEIWYDGIDQNCDGNDDDQDGDGSPIGTDCDDLDATRNPLATDIPYDGIDQNCDGEDTIDLDGDGFDGAQVGGTDCNDGDPSVHPDSDEIWYDGIDQNCDGNDDDQDNDGVSVDDDCDDQDASVGVCTGSEPPTSGPPPSEEPPSEPSGCATTPVTGSFGVVLLLMGFVRRRAR